MAPYDSADASSALSARGAEKNPKSYFYNNQVVALVWNLVSQTSKGRLPKDIAIVWNLAKVLLVDNGTIDDKDLLLERMIGLLSTLPDNETNARLSAAFIDIFWNDLPHPQPTLIGPDHRFMKADGSGNNPFIPDLGKAGSPYARSVAPRHLYTVDLPDPNVIFDKLLRQRTNDFVPHPSGVSSLFFAFASNVIHNVFRTSHAPGRHHINETSSYLDLATIYGNNQEDQHQIRTFQDGLIYPDVISEDRLFLQPPAVTAVTILFSRNHNWIAKELLKRDERNKYRGNGFTRSLSDMDRDEEIFQTARLINCGYFTQVILYDYLRTILNLVATDSTWILDPRTMHKTPAGAVIPYATGNVVSIEFNLLYRWHSTLSKADEQWTRDHFIHVFGTDDWDKISYADLAQGMARIKKEIGKDKKKWCIPGLKRTGADGTGPHRDEDIASVLQAACEETAGAFRARGIPDFMKIIEVMGIVEARNTWGVCTLNELRSFLGLKPYTNFKDFNSDPEIAKVMTELYGEPDNIELYPGLLAEEAKKSGEGAGLCPGYTMSRAILSDAVSLVRGDRFFTTDCNTHNLTRWGYQDIQSDPTNLARGGLLDKLIRRVLPGQYPEASVYSNFPFNTPDIMKKHLTRNRLVKKYNFETPPALKEAQEAARAPNKT